MPSPDPVSSPSSTVGRQTNLSANGSDSGRRGEERSNAISGYWEKWEEQESFISGCDSPLRFPSSSAFIFPFPRRKRRGRGKKKQNKQKTKPLCISSSDPNSEFKTKETEIAERGSNEAE